MKRFAFVAVVVSAAACSNQAGDPTVPTPIASPVIVNAPSAPVGGAAASPLVLRVTGPTGCVTASELPAVIVWDLN